MSDFDRYEVERLQKRLAAEEERCRILRSALHKIAGFHYVEEAWDAIDEALEKVAQVKE